MDFEIAYRDPSFANTLGHAVGTLLFGLLVFLFLKDWRRSRPGLSLAAALLALLWNLGALLIVASFAAKSFFLREFIIAFSFAALSLLPAVLLHGVLEKRQIWLVRAGYVLSAIVVVFHLSELASAKGESGLHLAASSVASFGFGALVLIAIVQLCLRERHTARFRHGLLALACLFVFSVSLIHFGYGHTDRVWAAEIAWHHAGIPLVLFVLLRDYRFFLLDVYSRFLFNFGLAAVYVAVLFWIHNRYHFLQQSAESDFGFGLSLVAICLVLISFAYLHSALQRWITRRLFLRGRYDICARFLATLGTTSQTEQQLLESAAQSIASYVATDHVQVVWPEGAGASHDHSRAVYQLPLRFSRGDSCGILLGQRRGGRRYLSEDISALRSLSNVLVEQVERFRSDALQKLVIEAELKALQSQINPHFLFNALNTLYGSIERTSQQARRTVLNLAEILRYSLRTDRSLIRLEQEMRIVQAYLEIEKLRLAERLTVELDVPKAAHPVLIPMLSIQPLVENAVKHGIASLNSPGVVRVSATPVDDGVQIEVHDTGPGFSKESKAPKSSEGSGIGLDNVRQRLRLYYGERSLLRIASTGAHTSVSFFVPHKWREPFAPASQNDPGAQSPLQAERR